MSRIIKPKEAYQKDPKAKPEIINRICPELEHVKEVVWVEKKKGRIVEEVVLSRFKYDRLEEYLRRVGILNEVTENNGGLCYDVNVGIPNKRKHIVWISCATSDTSDTLPIFKKTDLLKTQLDNLDFNAEMLNIQNNSHLDSALKEIKRKNKK
jgi:hypothetical protein